MDKRLGRPRVYSLNEGYFDVIDLESKAYWCGFLSADGCIYDNRVKLKLSLKDESHLTKFVNDLSSNQPIATGVDNLGYKWASVTINSKKMVNSLKRLGITERKSLSIYPARVDQDVKRHFWRGVVDGDGCIQIKKDSACVLNLVGSEAMCNGFSDWVESVSSSRPRVAKSRSIYSVDVCGDGRVHDVLAFLYGGSTVYLSRKKDRAADILSGKDVNGRATVMKRSKRDLVYI